VHHGERGAQLVRDVRDEVAAHLLEPHELGHVARDQELLVARVGDEPQAQAHVRPPGRGDVAQGLVLGAARDPRGVARIVEVAVEHAPALAFRVDPDQRARGAVAPDHRAALGQRDDGVGQGGGGLAELAQQRDLPAPAHPVHAEAAVHRARQVGPDPAILRRRAAAARHQPRLHPVEADECADGISGAGERERDGELAREPAGDQRDHEQQGEAPQRHLPSVALQQIEAAATHRLWRSRGYSGVAEKRYPAPRTVCTSASHANGSRVLRSRRMWTSTVRSSTSLPPPQTWSRSWARV
jgi:hypothetical protein